MNIKQYKLISDILIAISVFLIALFLILFIERVCSAVDNKFRNKEGKTVTTSTTRGKVTVTRDSKGRLSETATESSGKITYRDRHGKITGTKTISKGKK
jgi:uncharacterized protein YpmS